MVATVRPLEAELKAVLTQERIRASRIISFKKAFTRLET